MKSYLMPVGIGVVVGVLGFWLAGALLAPNPNSGHAPGPGKFKDWTGPHFKFLRIDLKAPAQGCPAKKDIDVDPSDSDAAVIWHKPGSQPKRVVWRAIGGSPGDEWTIKKKAKSENHLPTPAQKKIDKKQGHDALWTAKPSPVGKPIVTPNKEYWHWDYDVTLKRTVDGAPCEVTIDPPVYIRRR